MLLQQVSLKNKVYYVEKRAYKKGEVYKNYVLSINNKKLEFKNAIDLLQYLKGMI